LEFLIGILCISIGCAVAWILALYTRRGVRNLIWDTFLGAAGAAICAWVIVFFAPVLGAVGLVIGGPVFALVAIWIGDAARRAVAGRFYGNAGAP
jgi:hypothetical protein